jgi:hypothetical protein
LVLLYCQVLKKLSFLFKQNNIIGTKKINNIPTAAHGHACQGVDPPLPHPCTYEEKEKKVPSHPVKTPSEEEKKKKQKRNK